MLKEDAHHQKIILRKISREAGQFAMYNSSGKDPRQHFTVLLYNK